jgi:ABC-type Zn2+ transport system substrate-binding protein/surface adhesin
MTTIMRMTHGHRHGEHDPHAWLSPDQRGGLAERHRGRTVRRRPGQRGHLFRQRRRGQAKSWPRCIGRGKRILDPVRGGGFIVFHDAYQYFETAFDFPASGAISIGDATLTRAPRGSPKSKGVLRMKGSTACLPSRSSTPASWRR